MSDIHPTIADHYEAMNIALHERDKLTALARDLENELTVAKDKIDFLSNQIDKITRERDHYMRYSFALTTRVNAMQDIWTGMMELSKNEANSQLPAQLEKQIESE